MNQILNPIGLSISTTRKEAAERARLDRLATRGHWSGEPKYHHGVRFDAGRHLAFLKDAIATCEADCRTLPQTADQGEGGYYLQNNWFGSLDAEVLYAIIRRYRPATIVEVGCGFSTRLMRRAIRQGQLDTRITCIDPQPRVEIQEFADEHIASPVEDLSPDRIVGALHAGDILFIDSSHIVMTGGDVVFLFLEVLPLLEPGVFVHVHDIFLPYEYPRGWVDEHRWGFTEQYLVQALLYESAALEILWPAQHMWRTQPDEIRRLLPIEIGHAAPASLWLRKAA